MHISITNQTEFAELMNYLQIKGYKWLNGELPISSHTACQFDFKTPVGIIKGINVDEENELITWQIFESKINVTFNEYMIMNNKLPINYVVKIDRHNSKEQCTTVNNYYYHDNMEISDWKYIICHKYIASESNGYASRMAIHDTIIEKFKHLPVFTFSEWYKLAFPADMTSKINEFITEFKNNALAEDIEKISSVISEILVLKPTSKTITAPDYARLFKHGDWVYMTDDITDRIVLVDKIVSANELQYIEQYIIDKSNSSNHKFLDGVGIGHNVMAINGFQPNEVIRLATEEDLTYVMNFVAKVKGFADGVTYNSAYFGHDRYTCKFPLKATLHYNQLQLVDHNCRGNFIYFNGKWATINNDPKIKFGNDHGVFDKQNKSVKFGDKTFTVKQLEAIKIVMELNKQFVAEFELYGDERTGNCLIVGTNRRESLTGSDIDIMINFLK